VRRTSGDPKRSIAVIRVGDRVATCFGTYRVLGRDRAKVLLEDAAGDRWCVHIRRFEVDE